MQIVIMIRKTDSYEKAVAQKYRLKSLLNQGYKIERCDTTDGVIVYILGR